MDPWISPQAALDFVVQYWAKRQLQLDYCDSLREVLQETIDCAAALGASGTFLMTFPALCCQAVTDRPVEGIPQVTAAWLLYYAAARLVDGMADGEAACVDLDVGTTGNIAAGLIVSAGDLLCEIPDAAASKTVRGMFTCAVLAMCGGQHLALISAIPSLQMCWRLAELRSGIFFAAAAQAGARLATLDEKQLALFELYGHELGMLLQIGDDLKDLWPRPGYPSDLAVGIHRTLPVAYAMAVLPKNSHDRLRDLLKQAPSRAEAEAAARCQILDSGAAMYLAVEVERRRQCAGQALTNAVSPTPAYTALLALLEEIASRCIA